MGNNTTFELHNWLNELLGVNLFLNQDKTNLNEQSYFTLPNNSQPKLLFPVLLNKAGLVSSLDLYPVLTPKHYIKKQFISLLYKFQSLLPSKYFITIGNTDFARIIYGRISTLRTNDERVSQCSIRTGSAGKGKKLIFQFIDNKGKVISYIKLGDTKYRGKWLENEYKTLDFVNKECSDLITAPKILGYHKTSSFVSLEISPLMDFFYYPQKSYSKIADKLVQIVKRTKSESTIDFVVYDKMLQKCIIKPKLSNFIKKHISFAQSNCSVWALSHRDLPAWNVLSNNNDEFALLDWEFGRFGHNPLQDIFHYKVHTKLHNSSKTPEWIVDYILKDPRITKTIASSADQIGINNSKTIYSLFVMYLWDWYSLERDNAQSEEQGKSYLQMLEHLEKHENSPQYLI
jgi:hypothetical protein